MARHGSPARLLLVVAAGAAALGLHGWPWGSGFTGLDAGTRRPKAGMAAAKRKAAVGPPEQPRRPKNSYMLYLEDNRARIAESSSGGAAEVAKQAGEEWRALDSKKKAKYEKAAAKAKTSYEKALEAFKAAGGVVATRKTKKASKANEARDPKGPKRPVGGAYMVWLQENRQMIKDGLPSGHRVTDVTKAAGEQWRAMDSKAKAPFEKSYQERMEAYRREMERYEPAEAAAAA